MRSYRRSTLTSGQNRDSIFPMKWSLVLQIAFSAVGVGVSSCQSANVDTKADEYRRTGVARDMLEARRMAENYYWPASARSQDEERRGKNETFARKEEARR